jgi:hypothetical protein
MRGRDACIIRATARSATAMTAALVLPLTTFGIIDASKTRKPSTPRTRRSGSSTASGSSSRPILQVPTGW